MAKERPILFSKPMVLAILGGTKTQTRRIVKPQPQIETSMDASWRDSRADLWRNSKQYARDCCPYGRPGDRLWVRETFMAESKDTVHYCADGWDYSDSPNSGWKPSIFMPRWASRITLQITDARIERLNDISEEDAIAEGCQESPITAEDASGLPGLPGAIAKALAGGSFTAKFEYMMLWDEINGKDSYARNPWVWVISFERIPLELAQ